MQKKRKAEAFPFSKNELLDHIHGHVVSAGGLGDQLGRDLHLAGSDVGEQRVVVVNAPVLQGPGSGGQTHGVVLGTQRGGGAADGIPAACVVLTDGPLSGVSQTLHGRGDDGTGLEGLVNGKVIGVDVDQSFESSSVITSAMKGLADATAWAIGQHYDGAWDTIGGTSTSLGAKDNAVGLPTATWSLQNWSVDEYNALLADIAAGKVEISSELVAEPASTANVTVNMVK